MQFRVRKAAYVLERIGLAMAGAACGLFVAIHVGSSIAALTSQGFLVVMMIGGAIGFYLRIDTPPLTLKEPNGRPSRGCSGGKIDTAEFLSAVGTFIATLTAFISVGVIVLRESPHVFWTITIMAGWVVGLMMQIIAGAIARTRA
jgi:FtsH-binding integral membrane protein